jgi:hypothetical protein
LNNQNYYLTSFKTSNDFLIPHMLSIVLSQENNSNKNLGSTWVE